MRTSRAVTIALLAIALATAGAQPGHAARQATPEALRQGVAPPAGLESANLPRDEAGIEALFARLPDELSGEARSHLAVDIPGEVTAIYGQEDPDFGPPLFLRALDVSTGDFFAPGSTVGDVAALLAADPGAGVVASGQAGGIIWVRWETTAGVAGEGPGTPERTRPLYSLAWGEADSPWLYTAGAFTPEGLDALVAAFVAATDGAAPPAATPAGS